MHPVFDNHVALLPHGTSASAAIVAQVREAKAECSGDGPANLMLM